MIFTYHKKRNRPPATQAIPSGKAPRYIPGRYAYRDDKFEPELCHHCGVSYRGPALYCSLECAIADA